MNIIKINKKRKEKYYKNRDEIRKKSKEWREKKRLEIIKILGNKCIICGEKNIRYLQVDRILGGDHCRSVSWIRKNISEFQLLCANHHNEKTVYGKWE